MERRVGESTGDGLRCVLWHARGAIIDPGLVRVLLQRGIAWKAWDSDLLALAELCRESDPDSTNGSARIGHRTVLLLCDPAKLEHVRETMAAVERFRPAANVWVFDPTRTERLAGLRPREVVERYESAPSPARGARAEESIAGAPAHANPEPDGEADDGPVALRPLKAAAPVAPRPQTLVRNAPPRLRLTGEGALPPSVEEEVLDPSSDPNLPAPGVRRNVAGMGAILTDEEVAMLLAADDQTRRPPQG